MDCSFDEHVAIFWDYENCAPPCSVPGYDVVNNIRQVAHEYGSVKLFKAYLELSEQSSSKSIGLRSELQSCGVSLTDCPHNGRKDVADKMMIVDMLTYAIDNPAPATIVLISGDRDFVYAVSVLRLRRYRVVLVAPNCAHSSLKSQASAVLDWDVDIMRKTPARPQTLEASHSLSDDAMQRSPRRSSFGGQLPQPTPRSGRRSSFKVTTPMTPITPLELSNASGASSLFQGRHLRNPSIVTTDESCLAEPPTIAPRDTSSDGTASFASSFSRIGNDRDARTIMAQPPIQDIVEIMQDLKDMSLRAPSPHNRTNTDVPNTEGASADSVSTVNRPAPASSGPPLGIEPPVAPIETSNIGQVRRTDAPASAFPPHVNARPLIAPEPLAFLHLHFAPSIMRPATVEPLSRLSSAFSSPSNSTPSSGDVFHTAASVSSDDSSSVVSQTPPTSDVSTPSLCEGALSATRDQAHEPQPASTTQTAALGSATSAVALSSIPAYFHSLMETLEGSRLRGLENPLRSWVGLRIPQGTYSAASVSSFKQYTLAAEKAGIVVLGGLQSRAWIALSPEWHGRVPVESMAC